MDSPTRQYRPLGRLWRRRPFTWAHCELILAVAMVAKQPVEKIYITMASSIRIKPKCLELFECAGAVYRCTVIASKVVGRRNKRSSNIGG